MEKTFGTGSILLITLVTTILPKEMPPLTVMGVVIFMAQLTFFGIGGWVFASQKKNQTKVHEEELKERMLRRKAIETEIEYFELKKEKLK